MWMLRLCGTTATRHTGENQVPSDLPGVPARETSGPVSDGQRSGPVWESSESDEEADGVEQETSGLPLQEIDPAEEVGSGTPRAASPEPAILDPPVAEPESQEPEPQEPEPPEIQPEDQAVSDMDTAAPLETDS